MHAVVVGAGVGGLTTALFLRARGHSVTVLEQAAALEAAGAGLQISPNASRILFALGLEKELADAACEPWAVEMFEGETGRPLMRLPLVGARQRWGAPYLHLRRSDLQRILLDALTNGDEVEIRLAARITSVDPAAATATLEQGGTVGGDVLVGADGLRSAVRLAVAGDGRPRFTGQTAWRGLVPADKLPEALRIPGARVWLGPRRHFVSYPVKGGSLVNFVGVVEQAGWRTESWTERGDPADLARDFAGWASPVLDIAAAVETAWRWALFDRPPLERWSAGRTTLMGDAAHPMLPFLAQGAAMAIEDAEALARHLSSGLSPAVALEAYESERRSRTARVQDLSRRNATLFHLPTLPARGMFGAAAMANRLDPSGGMRRFDWLYGYVYE